MDSELLARLARRFRAFAERECGSSPLYRCLALGIAEDEALLRLAANAQTGQPVPNLLFAAVHYLLLKEAGQPGTRHALAAFYPTVSSAAAPGGDPFPHFRAFCLERTPEIAAILRSRQVQTNEVARAAVLLLGLHEVARRAARRPLALVEVGSSAGLLLNFDRYAYRYGNGPAVGDPDSPLLIRCQVNGPTPPPVPRSLPEVVWRVGLDIYPVRLHDPDEALWLYALVWADQVERATRLRIAIDLARRYPPNVVAGDALYKLPELVEACPPGSVPCVFHCHVLNQWRPAQREQFSHLLAEQSSHRELFVLSLEYPEVYGQESQGVPQMELHLYRNGRRVGSDALARYEAHGEWLQWL